MNALEQHDKQKQTLKAKPCTCNAYKFPHRRLSGGCQDDGLWMDNTDQLRLAAWQNYSERYK